LQNKSSQSLEAPDTKLAMTAVEAALDKKGLEPVLLDVSAEASYTDHILIISARSDRHAQAIADGIRAEVRARFGRSPRGVEGNTRDGQWALLDYGDLIIHVFYHPLREFYDLESLWSEARTVELKIPAESRFRPQDAYAM